MYRAAGTNVVMSPIWRVKLIQDVQTLTRDLHMQTRSLAEWELTGTRIAVQTCKHISFALTGLLIPFAVTVAVQAIHMLALVSISLFQSIWS